MRDDGPDVEARLEQPGETIPGLEEPPSGHAVNPDPLEDDLVRHVEADLRLRNAEERHASAVLDGAKALMDRRGAPGHFQRHVHALPVRRPLDQIGVVGVRIDRVVHAQLPGEIKPVVADVRGDDQAGAGGAGHGRRKEPGRAAARDQHRLAGNVLDQRRVDGVAQRLLQAGQFRGNLARGLPEHALREPHKFGVRAVHVDAQDAVVLADVRVAGPALEAHAAGDVRLGRDIVADGDHRDVRPDFHHFTAQLMADDAGRVNAALRPLVPSVDMVVGSAQRRGYDAHNHLAGPGLRLGNIQQLQAGSGLCFDQCAHGLSSRFSPPL